MRGRVVWRTLLSADHTPTAQLTLGVTEIGAGRPDPFLPHHHAQAEIYYVLAGEGIVHIDGVDHPLRAGSSVFIPGDTWNGARNTGSETLRMLYVFAADSFFSPTAMVRLPAAVVSSLIERTMYAASLDETRYNLNDEVRVPRPGGVALVHRLHREARLWRALDSSDHAWELAAASNPVIPFDRLLRIQDPPPRLARLGGDADREILRAVEAAPIARSQKRRTASCSAERSPDASDMPSESISARKRIARASFASRAARDGRCRKFSFQEGETPLDLDSRSMRATRSTTDAALPRPLLTRLRAHFALDWRGIHGAPHWARVRRNGLVLSERTGRVAGWCRCSRSCTTRVAGTMAGIAGTA